MEQTQLQSRSLTNTREAERIGLITVILCNVVWGVLPVYWDALKPIDSFVIIFYRIALMALVCFIASWWQQRSLRRVFAPLFASRRQTMIYLCAGFIITVNWSTYIWAVNAGRVIQCSMGYFMEPLMVCLFGVIFYRERVNGWKKFSMLLAVIGLLIMVIGYGEVPVVSVALGLTFAIYSAIKKSVHLPPLQSMLYETIFLTPVALCLIAVYEHNGTGAWQVGGHQFVLLFFAGIATAVPLGLFSFAAARLQLITLGLTEYISPSISLLLGIFLFREPFDVIQFSAFAVIWVGLIFFTYGEVQEMRTRRTGTQMSGTVTDKTDEMDKTDVIDETDMTGETDGEEAARHGAETQ